MGRHKTRTRIQQLGKDIHAKLRQASDIDHNAQVSVSLPFPSVYSYLLQFYVFCLLYLHLYINLKLQVVKKIADAKLTKNFQAALKDFQKAQRLAAERETSYAPFVPKQHVPSR